MLCRALSVGGGFLGACVVALSAYGFGRLLTGHFLRDLLGASPLLYWAYYLRRRAVPTEVRDGTLPLLGLVRILALAAIGFGIVAAPIGLFTGVFVNRYCDSSEPVEQSARVLGVEHSSRGVDTCFVESWRGSWTEQLSVSLVPCPVHGRIVLRTRAGVLGWPWVQSARVE